MSKELSILAHSVVRNSSISINGEKDFTSSEQDFKTFIKEAYRNYDLKYPKFFKMDSLCKLAVIGAEIAIENSDLAEILKDRIGIVLMNKASSLDTDREHQHSIDDRQNYFPSPATFVYTLANIMAGEIAIRHEFQGENMCFVLSEFNIDIMHQYVSNLFESGKIDVCLCGWVDFDGSNYESVQYIVGKNSSKNIIFDNCTIKEIYNLK